MPRASYSARTRAHCLPRASASVRSRAHCLPNVPAHGASARPCARMPTHTACRLPARCRDSSPHTRHLPTLTADTRPTRPPAVQPAHTVTRPFLNLATSCHMPSTGPVPWH
ncbi:UNVERIFIED_CONTAM: hypothetical protein Slati_4491600 [Sesamum latifolium]|uniref:Uncharacterized protein n=1 Tax=Sesamum latifolium TaxID=2727402 RepID=A0AAW2ST44_9LAMI